MARTSLVAAVLLLVLIANHIDCSTSMLTMNQWEKEKYCMEATYEKNYLEDFAKHCAPETWEDFFRDDEVLKAIASANAIREATKEKFVLEKSKNKVKSYQIEPPIERMFEAFKKVKPNDVKVIILGQDPTPQIGKATGRAFSVEDPRTVGSVMNVLLEVALEGWSVDLDNGDLSEWEKQGVLLLNSALTIGEITYEDPKKKTKTQKIPRGVATPVRPTERVPEPRPRPHASMQPAGFIGEMARSNPVIPYPFPGPRGARKLRHYGYAAWACFILISLLRKLIQRRLEASERLNNLINQAIDELHSKYYLEREGAMYAIFQDAIRDDAFDLKVKAPGVFQRLSQESQAAIKDLTSMIENIVYRVLQIRPTTGLLSTARESVLWEMTQVGVLLPQNYLWHVEQASILRRGQALSGQVVRVVRLGYVTEFS